MTTKTLTDLVRYARIKGKTRLQFTAARFNLIELGTGNFLWEPTMKMKDPTFHFWFDGMAIHITPPCGPKSCAQ